MAGTPRKRQRREAAIREAVTGTPGVTPPDPMALAIAGEPVFATRDLKVLDDIAASATPEEFQRAFGLLCRRLLIRGLEIMPAPRNIKELQAVADMIRKSEGMDGKNPMGVGAGLVAPRRVVRGKVGPVVDAETGEQDAPETEAAEDNFEV